MELKQVIGNNGTVNERNYKPFTRKVWESVLKQQRVREHKNGDL